MKPILKTAGWIFILMVLWSHTSTASEDTMELYSSAFENEENIPQNHTCEGDDLSPELTWTDVPEEARSLALIVDDPDAPMGTWVHWVAYNIPVKLDGLPEGISDDETLDNGMVQGVNDFKNYGYGGPCPPRGHGTHRYFFKLYALDSKLRLEPGATKAELMDAMEGHIIDEAEFMGTYSREP
jgi:hypothetical protein